MANRIYIPEPRERGGTLVLLLTVTGRGKSCKNARIHLQIVSQSYGLQFRTFLNNVFAVRGCIGPSSLHYGATEGLDKLPNCPCANCVVVRLEARHKLTIPIQSESKLEVDIATLAASNFYLNLSAPTIIQGCTWLPFVGEAWNTAHSL